MIISFPNEKGGAGKSTGCVCLAAAYADAHDKVLVIDTDTNATATRWLVPPATLATKLKPKGGKAPDARFLFTEDPIPTSVNGVDLTRPPILDLIAHVKEVAASGRYDHILIDLPGVRDQGNLKAMMISDLVIVVMAPDEAPYTGAVHAIEDLADLTERSSRKIPCRLLLTNVKLVAAPAGQTAIINAVGAAKLPRFDATLTNRSPYSDIGLTGLPPHAADRSSKTVQTAIAEIDAVVAEIAAMMKPARRAEKVA